MWSNLLANFKPKSGYRLVLVVVYYLVLTLSVCYSENVTSNAVKPIPNVSNTDNSSSTTLLLLLQPTTTIPTPTTTTIFSTEIPTSTTTVKLPAKIASSMLKRLSTIRPNVATNSASGSTNGVHSKNISTTLNTEKESSRNTRPKLSKTTSQQQQQPQQQQQQQSSQYKVLSWPSKPGGTYLIEGDFQYYSRYFFIFLSSLYDTLTLFVSHFKCRVHLPPPTSTDDESFIRWLARLFVLAQLMLVLFLSFSLWTIVYRCVFCSIFLFIYIDHVWRRCEKRRLEHQLLNNAKWLFIMISFFFFSTHSSFIISSSTCYFFSFLFCICRRALWAIFCSHSFCVSPLNFHFVLITTYPFRSSIFVIVYGAPNEMDGEQRFDGKQFFKKHERKQMSSE